MTINVEREKGIILVPVLLSYHPPRPSANIQNAWPGLGHIVNGNKVGGKPGTIAVILRVLQTMENRASR